MDYLNVGTVDYVNATPDTRWITWTPTGR